MGKIRSRLKSEGKREEDSAVVRRSRSTDTDRQTDRQASLSLSALFFLYVGGPPGEGTTRKCQNFLCFPPPPLFSTFHSLTLSLQLSPCVSITKLFGLYFSIYLLAQNVQSSLRLEAQALAGS